MLPTQIVLRDLDSRLKPDGFRRKGYTWNRARGEFVDVIELQKDSTRPLVTVNFGVFCSEVRSLIWPDAPPQGQKQEPSCLVRRRVQRQPGRGGWFERDPPNLVDALYEAIVNQALPLFDATTGREQMIEAISENRPRGTQDCVYIAVLMHALGQHESSCKVLRHEIGMAGNTKWGSILRELAGRLNCQVA